MTAGHPFVCVPGHKSNLVNWNCHVAVHHQRACVCVCLSACLSFLHPVRTLPSKSGPVFSRYHDMQRVPHVHTENRVPLFSGHLAWTISEGSSGSKRDFRSEALTYLSHNHTLATSMLYTLTFSPLCSLFHICSLHIFSLFLFSTILSGSSPEGFVLHMPRQLHKSPLHAQVYGHWLEGGYVLGWVWA